MGRGGPISKKAPGDRQLSAEEIREIAALIRARRDEGAVAPLPAPRIKEVAGILKRRDPPEIFDLLGLTPSRKTADRIARALERGEVSVSEVDLGGATGFRRENARPVCEVLLVEEDGELRSPGKPRTAGVSAGRPAIFLPAAFAALTSGKPHLLLQALLHPLLEWTFGLPHIVAVLCEAAYNETPPEAGRAAVSDLNRFIAEEAARDRDRRYFDRILGTRYEPDEFRMEELRAHFADDPQRIAEIVARAHETAERYRELAAGIVAGLELDSAREGLAAARRSLDEGNPDPALVLLRRIRLPEGAPAEMRDERKALIELAVRSFALDAAPAYEGLSLVNGEIRAEEGIGKAARDLAAMLEAAAAVVREKRDALWGKEGQDAATDPLGERGGPRTIHVVSDLERPSAKFIDGHDRVHWVFEKSFVDALLAGHAEGKYPEAICALLACRFVRDGAFPDEKLKMDRQLAVAVKGAVEGYRFYQSLSPETRRAMNEFVEGSGVGDPLYRLFLTLGDETHPSRAGRMIRSVVGRTHSFNYVRYPESPLAGRVVVITGGGTGMGRALALEAAMRGANVAITGRRPGPLEETAADMSDLIRYMGLSNEVIAVQGDVSDPKYVGEMFERVEREFGRIDILYNNAGVPGPVEFGAVYREEHFEQYREAVAVHLTGSCLASLEAARIMERQRGGGVIVMVGTFYSESIHRHVLHAYPGRLPYTCAQAAKLALGDYLAWALAGRNIAVLSINPSAVMTERIQRGEGVFDKGSRARARIGRSVPPEILEKDTLERTVAREFVRPRDFARVALAVHQPCFRRTVGGQRLSIGGVTYEQPPAVIPSPARLARYPDLVGKVALVTADRPLVSDAPLVESTVRALARAGASVVLAGPRAADFERVALTVNAAAGEGMATVAPAGLADPSEVQALFDGLPRLDVLVHFTGGVDWKRPLLSLPYEEWAACVERFGYVPRLLTWQAERRMDRDRTDGTIVVVGPDMSGIPSIRERNFVQIFQAMLRPAVATEAMERALMRKALAQGTAPAHASDINFGLVLPGRNDGRNRSPAAPALAATVLWLAGEGKKVSGAVLLPDEQNSLAALPPEPAPAPGTMSGRVVVVTGGIRNLGREISMRFAAERATVVAASRRPRPDGPPEEAAKAQAALRDADALLARMRESGGRAIWVDADVSNPRRVRALIEEARNRFGRIDAFVNNAGAGGDFALCGDVLRGHRASWEAVLRANFLGPWTAVSILRDVMGSRPEGGSIVNVSTRYADHPYLFRTIYTVSKILLKALTQALREPLAAANVHMVDVAPSLIAGPRMDWVMRNYAERFAGRFEAFGELPAAEREPLVELFLRSLDRAVAAPDRAAAASSFVSAVRDSRLPKGRRAELESWYARIRDWFRGTVPENPPANEEVAEAVLYAAKNARFLEDRFLNVSSLPPLAGFPGEPAFARKPLPAGAPCLILSAGDTEKPPVRESLLAALSRAGIPAASLVESPRFPGRAEIARPPAGRERPPEPAVREIDLSDPRVVESWLDPALLGLPPSAGAVVVIGPPAGRKPLLGRTPDEMNAFLTHVGKALNLFSEACRAVRAGGHVVTVVPRAETEEGVLLRAALRQIVRTALAEMRFLPGAKQLAVSLLSAPAQGSEREFARSVIDLLAGHAPSLVESMPVGRERP